MPFGGQERVFKFGNNTARILADNYEIEELEKNPYKYIPALFWAGLMTRKESNDLPENFSLETVCDWMDEAGEEACAALWLEASKCMGFISRMFVTTANMRQAQTQKHSE